ncbi:MAG TPA: hypothetical protein DEO60_04765, partial [Bacteroidales bacterium]|nr:hypothetical protein [Bacteroidales bacterium]
MKSILFFLCLNLFTLMAPQTIGGIILQDNNTQLMGNRFLTFNAVIRVNQIEVSRDKNVGYDERSLHTPSRVIKYREAIESGFPGAKITWAFSWLALHDTTSDYIKIRELVAGYHNKYGDD